jgi:hypothetical protein
MNFIGIKGHQGSPGIVGLPGIRGLPGVAGEVFITFYRLYIETNENDFSRKERGDKLVKEVSKVLLEELVKEDLKYVNKKLELSENN